MSTYGMLLHLAFASMGRVCLQIKDLGSGNFGTARLSRNKTTGALVAIKFIERGDKIDKNVEREIINHRMLIHPNIIKFNEVNEPSHTF